MGDEQDDSAFAPADEIREPDWSTDDSGGDAGGGDDDSAFQLPSDIREPDWES